MNNIEVEQLKRDIRKYYGDELIGKIFSMNEKKLSKLKKEIQEIKNLEVKTNKDQFRRKQLEKKLADAGSDIILTTAGAAGQGLAKVKTITTSRSRSSVSRPEPQPATIKATDRVSNTIQKIPWPTNRKPSVLFLSDVKNWAWWIKSQYLKKYLSDEFVIDVVCTVGKGCYEWGIPVNKKYDLYFTFGYTYIDFLPHIQKSKKATGVTAHRPKNVIFPKMKQAGHLHANSMMLYRELRNMGFKTVHYVPNGVDEELFRPIKPIPLERENIICGHVGKESPHKGQREFIFPAIKKAGANRVSNISTYVGAIPHTEMYKIYQDMDVFMVASTEDGTPNPALEAAACGRPIISNRIGNMPELIKDGVNGFLVDKNIDDYVEKIQWLQANRDKMIKMGEEARKTIEEEWTWEIQAENYRNMFRKIFVKKEG